MFGFPSELRATENGRRKGLPKHFDLLKRAILKKGKKRTDGVDSRGGTFNNGRHQESPNLSPWFVPFVDENH
jgi:hypothetical protein